VAFEDASRARVSMASSCSRGDACTKSRRVTRHARATHYATRARGADACVREARAASACVIAPSCV
jgi:hypothetical protein